MTISIQNSPKYQQLLKEANEFPGVIGAASKLTIDVIDAMDEAGLFDGSFCDKLCDSISEFGDKVREKFSKDPYSAKLIELYDEINSKGQKESSYPIDEP